MSPGNSAGAASARVRAADSVLDHAKAAMEFEDLDARVAELERLANPGTSVACGEIIDITADRIEKRGERRPNDSQP